MKTTAKHITLRCAAGFLLLGMAVWYGILLAEKSSQNIGLADVTGDRAMLGGVEIAAYVSDGTFENDATISAEGVKNRVHLIEDGKGAEWEAYTYLNLTPDLSGAHSAATLHGVSGETAQPLDAISSRTTSMYYLMAAQTFYPTVIYESRDRKSRARIVLADAAYTAPTADGLAFAAQLQWNQGSYRAGDWSTSNGMGRLIADSEALVQDAQAAQLAEQLCAANSGDQSLTAADGTTYLWVNLPEGWGSGSRLYRIDSMEPGAAGASAGATVGDGIPQENSHSAIGTATLLTAFEPGDEILGAAEADGGLAVILCRSDQIWAAAVSADGTHKSLKQLYSLPFSEKDGGLSLAFCARYAGEPDTDVSFVCEATDQSGWSDTSSDTGMGTVQYATAIRITGGRVAAARTEAAAMMPGTAQAGPFAGENLTTFDPDAALLPGVQRLTNASYTAQNAEGANVPDSMMLCRLDGAYLTADGSALVTVEYIPTFSGRPMYDTQYNYSGQRTISVTGDGGLLYRGRITDTMQEDAQTWYRYNAHTIRSMICCAEAQGKFWCVHF